MNPYSIRIVSLDSCMCTPIQGLDITYSEFRGASVNQVPILRLFGSTSTGEKICVHIHGVFPYLYIPYDGTQEPNSLMYKIATNIDKAVNISLNQASSVSQHVYKISLVTGIPMYGYHNKKHQFFKIYLYNPLLIRKVTSLLMNESTLGKLYQPHEAHLNFSLQFMIDYNLHGMSNMILSKMKFRRDPNNPSPNIDPELFLPATVTKTTVCELEGDCLAEHIVNREEIASGNIAANPGIAALWEDERQRRRNKGEISQIGPFLELQRTAIEPTKSHFIYKHALNERLSVFSSDRNVVDKMNASVYPAETPDNLSIRNASMVDSQTPSSLESSLNDSSSFSFNDLDETIRPSQDIDVNVTLDQDALNLLELLNELEEGAKKTFEDSILTQVANEDDEEKDLDLSMPLESVTTPKKICLPKDDGSDDDLWNNTLIPQLDGESGVVSKKSRIKNHLSFEKKVCDLDIEEGNINNVIIEKPLSGILIKKAMYIQLLRQGVAGRDMPDLDADWQDIPATTTETAERTNIFTSTVKTKKSVRFKRPIATIMGEKKKKATRKRRKPTRKELKERNARKTQEEIRKLENRINKLNRQDQIIMIMRKIHQREHKMIVFLSSNNAPKFRVISKDKVQPLYPLRNSKNEQNFSNVKIISDIILKTANYIDPTLHLKIKYPNHCCYLYNYNNKIIPDVIRIPRKICQSRNDEDMKLFIKPNIIDFQLNETEKIEQVSHEDLFVSQKEPSIVVQSSKPYIFSHKYLSEVTDPPLVENMPVQTDEQLYQTAESLRNRLQQHIRMLWLPPKAESDNSNANFSSDDERSSILGKIKCLNSQEMSYSDDDNNNCDTFQSQECSEIKEDEFYSHYLRNENIDLKICKIVKHSPPSDSPEYVQYGSEKLSDIGNCWNFLHEKNCSVSEEKVINLKSGYILEDSSTSDNDSSYDTKRKFRNRKAAAYNRLQPSRRSERIRTRQETTRVLSLDGNVDSCSSDDEETIGVKRKRSVKRTPGREQRYKALPISVNKSPKVPCDWNESANKCEVSLNIQNLQEEATSLVQKPTKNTVCDLNVKRQLFSSQPTVHSAIIEEKLMCRYFSTNRENEIFEDNADDATSNSSTIFSSDDEQKNHLVQLNFASAAEKYDKETNYRAKEGTSKTLTQNSPQNFHHSSGSSDIPPNQQAEKDTTNFKASQKENSGTDDIFSSEHEEMSPPQLVGNHNSSSVIVSVKPTNRAPSKREVINTMDKYGIVHVQQQLPFYSNVDDVTGSVEVGFNVLKINSKTTMHLPEFESQTDSLNSYRKDRLDKFSSNFQWNTASIKNVILSFCKDRECIITPVKKPPTFKMILKSIQESATRNSTPEKRSEKFKIHLPLSPTTKGEDDLDMSLTLTPCTPSTSQSNTSQNNTHEPSKSTEGSTSPIYGRECRERKKQILNQTLMKPLFLSQNSSVNDSCQITGATVNNSFEKSAQNLQNARVNIEHQNLTVLVMELHMQTRGDFKPDPSLDSIRAIFFSILHDVPEPSSKPNNSSGMIAVNSLPRLANVPILNGLGLDCDITYVDSEENLLNEFLKVVAYWDPDICAGYEIQLLSWGYLIERASVIGINIALSLGRTKINSPKWKDEDGPNELKITGRIVLDVWRLMRHEIALQSYTFENIVFHILHRRVAYYSFKDLSFWWEHPSNLYRHRTFKYYLIRITAVLELFYKLDFLGRTSELARLFGIQFFEVLSRGTQFRVESMMLRLAKPLNFIPVSPSVQQRAHMKAPEYIALVMEPESKLYNDPVIVLDFQSLYPSLIIAYNYCFTTCIGRVQSLGKSGPFDFGATQLRVSRKRLKKLLDKDLLNFAPCGVGFVKKTVRDGIMPRMLREILDARLMVKNAMKENKDDKVLQKVLHNRQLGLKLIANVTYGYTAANFSGRMPSVEVGDSVVSKGRETLQRAIEMVDNTPEWGARVVYGDTDSLFVMVAGRSREYAFEVGRKIADAVTKANPDPIKLKLEKVYQPCILQTKKRYVGYMYETADQKDPIYEAKGIETVRRDGCPAVSKMLEKCLRLLFETKDVSLIKKYVLKQFNKILLGRASIQDLTFAKEYRGAAGYRPGACVPALELTRKWTAVDKRNEPRSGERVPYIIINGPPGLPLIRLVRSPIDLLNDPSLRPNALYYITRVIIPPINRCLNLIGADLHTWFNQMPRKVIQYLSSSVSPKRKSTISHYFSTTTCASCSEHTQQGICQNCCNNPQITIITLMEKMRMWERQHQISNMICQSCTGSLTEIKCVSLDCPILYRRVQTGRDVQQVTYVRQLLSTSF